MDYFKLSEFDSPDMPGSGSNMDQDMIDRLIRAREYSGVPYRITSGYRTKKHNKTVGGSKTSSHMKGVAVDIHCTKSGSRQRILTGLIKAGFTRIGIANTFIHADTDDDKPDVIWLY